MQCIVVSFRIITNDSKVDFPHLSSPTNSIVIVCGSMTNKMQARKKGKRKKKNSKEESVYSKEVTLLDIHRRDAVNTVVLFE